MMEQTSTGKNWSKQRTQWFFAALLVTMLDYFTTVYILVTGGFELNPFYVFACNFYDMPILQSILLGKLTVLLLIQVIEEWFAHNENEGVLYSCYAAATLMVVFGNVAVIYGALH